MRTKVHQKSHEAPGVAIAEDGGRSLCLRGVDIYSHGDPRVSVQLGECGGKVEQARRYRRDVVIGQFPTVGRRMDNNAHEEVL